MAERLTFKKLWDPGQTLPVVGTWTAHFQSSMVPVVQIDDDEGPDPILSLKISLRRSEKSIGSFAYEPPMLFIFPNFVPGKLREPLLAMINKVYGVADDSDKLDAIWAKKLKKNWPPAEETWKWAIDKD